MTTENTSPSSPSPVSDAGTTEPQRRSPAPPSWPWRRGALILVGTVKLWQEQP